MAMMTLLRQCRELGQELGRDIERATATVPPGLAALLAVAIVCAACAILVAVALATGGETGLFMAGLFTAVGQWWGGLTARPTGAGWGHRGGELARRVVTFLTPAEAAAAATTLTLAQLAPRTSGQTDIDLDRLLEAATVPAS
jgi:hypothetical protein